MSNFKPVETKSAIQSGPSGFKHRLIKAVVVVACVLICIMPQLRYAALHSAFYDLGQYTTNYMLATDWNFAGILLRGHAHLIMAVFVPLFKLLPHVETLLALQSLILISGIWLYSRLWSQLGAGTAYSGWTGSLVLVLSLSIWSSALFDYHFEHVLVPLYVLFFWRLETSGRWQNIGLIVLALAIAMTKESYALTSVGLGLYLLLSHRKGLVGCVIMALSLCYFLVVTMQVIPAFSDGLDSGQLWQRAFSYLGRTPLEMVTHVLTQPSRLIEANALTPAKLIYAGALLAPFLIALWRVPLMLVPALPSLAIAILSLEPNHSYLVNQYSVSVTMPVVMAFLYAMAGRRDWSAPIWHPTGTLLGDERKLILGFAVSGSLVCLLLFSPAPLSRLFWKQEAWSYHFSAYLPTQRDREIQTLIERHITADPDYAVSMQNTVHSDRLSLRYHALGFPQGVFEPARMLPAAAKRHQAVTGRLAPEGMIWVDYVVLDQKRPAYMDDRPVNMGIGKNENDEVILKTLYARLPQDFQQIADYDGFQIWQRQTKAKSP